jgi:hypothetical protein
MADVIKISSKRFKKQPKLLREFSKGQCRPFIFCTENGRHFPSVTCRIAFQAQTNLNEASLTALTWRTGPDTMSKLEMVMQSSPAL